MPAADEAAQEAVVEPSPTEGNAPEVTAEALRQRLRQQEILAELGVRSLQGTPFPELLDHTVRMVAEGMQVEFCKLMEHLPAEGYFVVRAGVGWDPGELAAAKVGADLDSPAGFALHTGKPVISNHLEHEERFRTPALLLEHGIRRAMNVVLQGEGDPFGVLEVDSRSPGEFAAHDLSFLQGAANILGMAIERQRIEARLRDALKERETLLQEVNHRVKNSLQLVASMLNLQASSSAGEERVRQALIEASTRIAAIARAHQRLYRSDDIRRIDLSAYLVDLCQDLNAVRTDCFIAVVAPAPIQIATDRAIPIALVVNELVTNAVKHGCAGSEPAQVEVRLEASGPDEVVLSVSDNGAGLPPGFDPATSGGLGMRIVLAFAQQLGAVLEFGPRAKGTEFALRIPLRRAA